jgi:hypothetical protein
MDYNGYWAPLEYLYTSSSSRVLVSRHPESCIEEYQGFMYCPQCLTRFQGDEVKEYKNCCVNCLKCPMCTTVPISMFVLENGTHAYRCGYCLWTSETAQLTGVDKSDLEVEIIFMCIYVMKYSISLCILHRKSWLCGSALRLRTLSRFYYLHI